MKRFQLFYLFSFVAVLLPACRKADSSADQSRTSVASPQLLETEQEEAALRLPPKMMLILPKEAKPLVGERLPLTCLAEFPYNVRKDISQLVSWSLDREDLATIDNQGTLNVKGAGEIVITASYRGIGATQTLQLQERSIRQVLLFPQDLSLELPAIVGGYEPRHFQLEAFGLFTDGELTDLTQSCTWTEGGGSGVSAHPTIKGKYTATAAGEYSFRVQCRNFLAERKVQVKLGSKKPRSLSIPEAPLVMSKGESRPFSVILSYSDGSTVDVTSTAEISGGSSLVVREGAQLRSIASGDTQLLVRHSGVSTELSLHVSPARPTGLRFQPTGFAVQVGTFYPVRVHADFSDGSSEEVTSAVTLSSLAPSNFRMASGSPTIEGLQAGSGQIQAQYRGVTAVAPVDIGQAVLEKIFIEPGRLEVVAGLSTTYRVWGRLTDQSIIELTSLANAVPLSLSRAEVPAGQRGQVNGKTQGSTSLSVSYIDPDGRNLTATAPLIVLPAQLVTMSLEPSAASLALGRSQEFRVRGLYTDQSEQDLSDKVQVMANVLAPHAPVAKIFFTSTGRIRLQSTAVGSMVLEVKLGTFTDSSTLTVTDKVLEDLYIQRLGTFQGQGRIYKSETTRFKAIAIFSDLTEEDVTVDGADFTSTWTLPPSSIATLENALGQNSNTEKLFTALSEGDAMFSVTYTSATRGTRSATFNIGVYTTCSSPGFVDSYYCYYLGQEGESCTATCNAVGRSNHPATISAIGHSGSSESCNRVLTHGFRSAFTNFNYAASAPEGIGCSIFTLSDLNLGLRESTRTTTNDAFAADFRRVCACQGGS